MSLVYNLDHRFVKFGGRLDYCMFCAQDKMVEDKISYGEAVIDLRGDQEGERVIRFRRSGADIMICKKHIKEMHDAIAGEEEEVESEKDD